MLFDEIISLQPLTCDSCIVWLNQCLRYRGLDLHRNQMQMACATVMRLSENKYPNVWCSLSVHVSHPGCNFPTKSCRERHIKSHISGYQWDIRKRVGRRLSGLSVSLLYIWRTSQRRILLEKVLQSLANYYTRSCWPICFHTSLSAQGLQAVHFHQRTLQPPTSTDSKSLDMNHQFQGAVNEARLDKDITCDRSIFHEIHYPGRWANALIACCLVTNSLW